MLVFIVTVLLALIAATGWLFLKRDPDRYIHEQKSPINFFFKWGRLYHHFFKVGIIAVFLVLIFSLYKYLLNTSNTFAIALALIAGIVLSGGKELLDKDIQTDDIFSSFLGIALGLSIIMLFFW
jgi:hypothetical protein